jgi:hypothetical protein
MLQMEEKYIIYICMSNHEYMIYIYIMIKCGKVANTIMHLKDIGIQGLVRMLLQKRFPFFEASSSK